LILLNQYAIANNINKHEIVLIQLENQNGNQRSIIIIACTYII